MNVGQVRRALGGDRDERTGVDELPVMIWVDDSKLDGRWMTVRSVKPDDDRVVLILEPFQ